MRDGCQLRHKLGYLFESVCWTSNTRSVITFEDTECNQLALSLYIAGSEDGVLNLAKFDSKTVQLDLIIFSSEAFKRAISIPVGQISSAVK